MRALLALAGFCAATLLAANVSAISINAIYRSACDREIGVIIDVQKGELTLLGLDGQVRKIPRYEVVSIAYYPASHVDIDAERVHPMQPAMRVGTLQDGRLVGLVDGWPVDFNEERIAFISLDGREVLVGRDRIWSLEYLENLQPRARPNRRQQLTFVHPHAVGFCNQAPPEPSARVLYPQQFINDGVVIKRELDRLMEGHQGVKEYERDQIFYPVPQLYQERTVLGLWTSHGQKHGATPGRPNNFTPVLTDQVSLGPFSYQHILVTGAAPMPFSVHTEVQTQLYYRFKAAYFHASAMFDPNLLMVGSEYFGSAGDLASTHPDLRVWEFLMVELGFDWGPLALQLSPGAGAVVAARSGDLFHTTEIPLFRLGPRVRFVSWMAEAWFGFSEEDRGLPMRWMRLNGWFDYDENLRISASLLARDLDLVLYPEYPDPAFRMTDRAYAGCAEARYTLLHRYDVGARVSVETAETRARTEADAPLGQARTTKFIGSWYVGLSF